MKGFSLGALLGTGAVLILVGVVLMFTHQNHEVAFQLRLLDKYNDNYHWRSVGDAYFGVSAIIVGGVMMAVTAIVARWP
jgi:drug/metabolite transporter (DMT)-like permease